MKRTEIKAESEIKRLDDLNSDRLETTKKRAAHAFKLVFAYASSRFEFELDKVVSDIAHAVNLLESAVQEMRWHCEWFEYDEGVCNLLDDACADFGGAMSEITGNDEPDSIVIQSGVHDGCVKLSKALATLIRWDDETQDVSEV